MLIDSFRDIRHMGRLCVVVMGAAMLAACGDSGPSSSDIESDFKLNQLPGLLELEKFSLEDSKNTGSEDRPVWMARYSAEVSLKEDTYDIDTVKRGVRLLKPVRSAGEDFTLYGRVRSKPAGETWRHEFELDSGTELVLGRPLSSYGPDALILGSDEARTLLAEVEKQREQERIARETRLAEEAAERQRAEEAEKAQRQRIEDAVARHNAAFAPETLGKTGLGYGEKKAFLITASTNGRRAVYGTDLYTGRSDFSKAVIHAGLLKSGKTGIVEVTKLDEQYSNFRGTPRNGIDSQSASATYFTFSLRLLEELVINTE